MLARLKKEIPTPENAASPLAGVTVPPRPASIRAATDTAAAAFAELEGVRIRHQEAARQFQAQKPGQPVVITQNEVDEIGKQIAGFVSRYETAAAAAQAERDTYQAMVDAATAEPLRSHAAELSRRLDELEVLAAEGVALYQAARVQTIELPSNVAGLCEHLIKLTILPGRQILSKQRARR